MQKICFVAGGSGGHILPAITLSKKWALANKGDVVFFTTEVLLSKGLDKRLFQDKPWITKVYFNTLSRAPSRILAYPKFLIQCLWLFFKSFFVFLFNRPAKIVSTGGFVSIPVCLAGKALGVSIELYELNSTPGRATRLLGGIANKVNVTFEGCAKFFPRKSELVSYPVRFGDEDRVYQRKELVKEFGFDEDRKTIFVCCGSQGSVSLNNIFKNWIESNEKFYTDIQVIHQTGSSDSTDWKTFYKNRGFPFLIFDYYEDVKKLYQMADVVICRAGAGTIADIKFFEKKALIIPLKTGSTSHQVENALSTSLSSSGLLTCVDQEKVELRPNIFHEFLIKKIL